MKRFVEVPADRLESMLDEIGKAVASRGCQASWSTEGFERVFTITVPHHKTAECAQIRVFTTLSAGANTARGCGVDAVRIVVGTPVGPRWVSLREPHKVLRTAPAKATDRVGVFLNRLKAEIRDAYSFVKNAPSCAKCQCPYMAERHSSYGAFWGCILYPTCKGVRNA